MPEPRRKRNYADDGSITYEQLVHVPKPRWDDDAPDPNASTYLGSTHGPSPVPDWVITQDAARQHDLGILKTGKEADVHLVERTLGDHRNLLAAKRYRKLAERQFRDDARYRETWEIRDTRMRRAIHRGTARGMAFRAEHWVTTEFDALCRLWSAGVSVPYPVQLLGTEVMLEYLGDDDHAAPRLVHAASQLGAADLADLADQAVGALNGLLDQRLVHGDMSPYNLLVWHKRLYLIDLPQAVDASSDEAVELLRRDVDNVIGWFVRKGVPGLDADSLYEDLVLRAITGC